MFESLPTIVQDKVIDVDYLNKIKANLDHLFGIIGGFPANGVPNGGAEVDSDSDGVPDCWTVVLLPSGAASLETSSPISGTRSFKMTRTAGAGNGGAYMDSDYIPVSDQEQYAFAWKMRCSAAGIKVLVQVRCYNAAKTEIANEGSSYDTDSNGLKESVLYASTTNPTADTIKYAEFVPLLGTRFIKIRLVGGWTDTDVAGDVVFDDVDVHSRGVQSVRAIITGAFNSTYTVTMDGSADGCVDADLGAFGYGMRTQVAGDRNVALAACGASGNIALPPGVWTIIAHVRVDEGTSSVKITAVAMRQG